MGGADPPSQQSLIDHPLTTGRAFLVLVALAFAAAALVGLVSRTPASVRVPGPSFYDLEVGESAANFTSDQIARHAAYRGPLYLAFFLGLALQLGFLVLLRGEPITTLVRATERVPGGPLVQAAAVTGLVAWLAWLVAVPLSFVRGYAIQKAWGLSTQDIGGWATDQLKGLGVSVVIAGIAGLVFFAIVRWQPASWWLWLATAFSVLTVVMVLLFPVVIAPLFNRFSPLQDSALEQRIVTLAERADIDIDDGLVADASRRSTAENAYVAGLGPTKQVVVYDTLLEGADEDELLFVVAHELGHRAERHIFKQIVISIVGLFAGLAILRWLVTRGPILSWTGAGSLDDLRVLPALLLFVAVAGLLTMPIESGISRSFERTADRRAFELIEDPVPAAGAFRRLAIANIADLRPPRLLVWLMYTHPPIADRIRSAEARSVSKP